MYQHDDLDSVRAPHQASLEQDNAETDERVAKWTSAGSTRPTANGSTKSQAKLGEIARHAPAQPRGRPGPTPPRPGAESGKPNSSREAEAVTSKTALEPSIAILQSAVEPDGHAGRAASHEDFSLMGLCRGTCTRHRPGVPASERGDNGFRTKDELRTLLPGAIIVTDPEHRAGQRPRTLRILSRAVGACMLFATGDRHAGPDRDPPRMVGRHLPHPAAARLDEELAQASRQRLKKTTPRCSKCRL